MIKNTYQLVRDDTSLKINNLKDKQTVFDIPISILKYPDMYPDKLFITGTTQMMVIAGYILHTVSKEFIPVHCEVFTQERIGHRHIHKGDYSDICLYKLVNTEHDLGVIVPMPTYDDHAPRLLVNNGINYYKILFGNSDELAIIVDRIKANIKFVSLVMISYSKNSELFTSLLSNHLPYSLGKRLLDSNVYSYLVPKLDESKGTISNRYVEINYKNNTQYISKELKTEIRKRGGWFNQILHTDNTEFISNSVLGAYITSDNDNVDKCKVIKTLETFKLNQEVSFIPKFKNIILNSFDIDTIEIVNRYTVRYKVSALYTDDTRPVLCEGGRNDYYSSKYFNPVKDKLKIDLVNNDTFVEDTNDETLISNDYIYIPEIGTNIESIGTNVKGRIISVQINRQTILVFVKVPLEDGFNTISFDWTHLLIPDSKRCNYYRIPIDYDILK